MTKRIWKFNLEPHGPTIVEARQNASVVSAGFDAGGELVVWIAVDPGGPLEQYTFHTVFTGEDIPRHAIWIATVVQPESGLVYHLFRELPHD